MKANIEVLTFYSADNYCSVLPRSISDYKLKEKSIDYLKKALED